MTRRKLARKRLAVLHSLIPQPGPVDPDSIDAAFGLPCDELAEELTRLHDGLWSRPKDGYKAISAIGRLRRLYCLDSQRPRFTAELVAALTELVESYSSLSGVPPLVRVDGGGYTHVGGADTRAAFGYAPQHRSRFSRLWH